MWHDVSMETTQEFSKKEIFFILLMAIGLLTITIIAIIPKYRIEFKDYFLMNDRKIISTVSGKLFPEGPTIKILKIKQNESIFLEIYSIKSHESEINITNTELNSQNLFISKLDLEGTKDGYFTFKGNATNLALSDIDNDSILEILAATYDEGSEPRLNIFKYSKENEAFYKISSAQRENL